MEKGTCLLSYLPMRSEPRSGAEMLNTILFGESYDIIERQNEWSRVKCHFDGYEAWISNGSISDFIEYKHLNDALFVEATANGAKIYLPCGSMLPDSGKFVIDGNEYSILQKLKTNHHLPLNLRILNVAKSFLNAPYLWGGRSFMGVDCSGLMQVVFKVNGFSAPRDTSEQINVGREIHYGEHQACDLVFFKKPGAEKVSHVGLLIDNHRVLHAGARVRINLLNEKGLLIDDRLAYETLVIKRWI